MKKRTNPSSPLFTLSEDRAIIVDSAVFVYRAFIDESEGEDEGKLRRRKTSSP